MAFQGPAATLVHSEFTREHIEMNANPEGALPIAPCVVGSFAVAMRLYRARSAGAHSHRRTQTNEGVDQLQPSAKGFQRHGATAIGRRMSSRRPKQVQSPIVPDIHPTPPTTPKSSTGRCKFRVRAKSGFSDRKRHVPDAACGKCEVPRPPTSPKLEKGLRPRVRASALSSHFSFPAYLQHQAEDVPSTEDPKSEEDEEEEEEEDSNDTITTPTHCRSISSLDGVMAPPNDFWWLER